MLVILIVDALHYCFSSYGAPEPLPLPSFASECTQTASPACLPQHHASGACHRPKPLVPTYGKGTAGSGDRRSEPHALPKSCFRASGAYYWANVGLESCLPQEVPRQELTSGEQKANIVKSVRYGPTPRQPRSGDAERGEPQGTPRDTRAS
jgi:hypothetical protein